MRIFFSLLVFIGLISIIACGKTGPLYLPDEQEPVIETPEGESSSEADAVKGE